MVVACLVANLLAACHGPGEPADETVPAAGDQPTEEPAAGGEPTQEPAATLPAGFPDDVPVYPGALPTGSLAATGKGMVVTFQSADPPQKVLSFYRAQFVERGWSISGEASILGQGALSGTKGDRTASVVVVGATGGAQIIVTAATMH